MRQRLCVWIGMLLLAAPSLAGCAGGHANEFSGLMYVDILWQDSGQWQQTPTPATLRLDSGTVDGNTLDLVGEIAYGDVALPFHLVGEFYQSRIGPLLDNPRDKVADIEDWTGNFWMVHFALREHPRQELVVTPDAVDIEGAVLSVYLQRDGAYEHVFFDVPVNALAVGDSLTQVLDLDLPEGVHNLDSWTGRTRSPDSTPLCDLRPCPSR